MRDFTGRSKDSREYHYSQKLGISESIAFLLLFFLRIGKAAHGIKGFEILPKENCSMQKCGYLKDSFDDNEDFMVKKIKRRLVNLKAKPLGNKFISKFQRNS